MVLQKSNQFRRETRKPKFNFVVTGLYFYDKFQWNIQNLLSHQFIENQRLQILNKMYSEKGDLKLKTLRRGYVQLDTGPALLQTTSFVETVQDTQGLKIACLEEIVYNLG